MLSAHLIGYPRIGPARELKWALEGAWNGRLAPAEFSARIDGLRRAHLDEQRALIGSAVDDFFLYDEVLETALMLGIAPEPLRARLADDPFGVLSALARGTPDREAWAMTKWFDTNYHYVVPERSADHGTGDERLTPLPWRVPLTGDPSVTWAVLGPYSLLKLIKHETDGAGVELSGALGRAYWSFVREQAGRDPSFRLQLDEPCLGLV
ncbi:MAG: 5-methyltetrahydropteroyltriglutamate--homocysteine S-methyltransferase, partial [Candidatus Limnocylindria bacterium]